jgi:fatty-acyl-CoA synthase
MSEFRTENLATICPLTTADALRRAATLAPDVEAVVDSTRRVTYLQLEREVQAIRAALWRAGVRRGDHVGICAGNSATWVALFLGTGAAGARSRTPCGRPACKCCSSPIGF